MSQTKMSKYRWTICTLLFVATTINYLDRQVLSLTWKDYFVPEFHWTDSDYGTITALFSLFYAGSMLVAGRFVDWMDTKKGFLWAIGIWSVGACIHAFCGIATSGIITGTWAMSFAGAKQALSTVGNTTLILSTSLSLFIFARFVLALGEAGNFPAAIKATAEYFPKKDRAFATSIFNAGATVGALAAPVTIPYIAEAYGWEMSFIIIGALGFIWMFFWILLYGKPENHPRVSKTELAYIQQDIVAHEQVSETVTAASPTKRLSFTDCLKFKQTWAFAFGKFMTDGVWWFYLFWSPAYLKDIYKMSGTESAFPLFILYVITLLSIIGGWLPSYFIGKKNMNPYDGRMKSMLIFAFFPLLALLAQPLGHYTYWLPVIIIGIAGAAHQAWSANIFTTVSDMFPRQAIATVTGIGGMAGGLGSFFINKGSGVLFTYAGDTQMTFMGFQGKEAGYFIVFSFCAIAYLIGWTVMKALVPKYKVIEVK
ncbi:MFS transporter [Pedobacter sp. HDW13]|uniref:MFS transporter n=1 Tax=unclassified Pedobacter TaxID=2628915 RepID=UPI000F5A8BB1|nr:MULTISPECIES: MFS transporter [unclassified Pedobacter]QIL39321.1 MFS transporter [Pedobacter sp. HDW13]RQO65591.1 MFS transporter [Pedobacter sp. KBW01]